MTTRCLVNFHIYQHRILSPPTTPTTPSNCRANTTKKQEPNNHDQNNTTTKFRKEKKKPPPPPRKNILTTKKRRTSPATGSFARAHTRGGGIGDAGRRWDRKMRVRKSRDTAMAAPLRRNGERKRRGEGVERARNKEGKREKLVSSFFRLFFLTCAYLSMSGTRRWGPFCLLTCIVGGRLIACELAPGFRVDPTSDIGTSWFFFFYKRYYLLLSKKKNREWAVSWTTRPKETFSDAEFGCVFVKNSCFVFVIK